ncbi:MAG: DNA topoisomerase I [Rhodospirillaceae bacterium]|jgi:DNA topoisomerase-1|nr:DNA topoisomerase I [Rhodospirillaceae bacterium]|tara:strand:- start:2606 stop:5227 length:2622 start_codon:yes stop_codon:yes gene_type:complete
MTNVVIVESPAKAKTINKYLGQDYKVLASYGHVRDLPSKDGSVRPESDFEMDWEIDDRAKKHLKEIAEAVKSADRLYLATDPDREGEAISWHVREVLETANALTGVDVKRVVFNEVTKSAILKAFEHPRELDTELVDAYLARRALDYLVGFTLSPVLWRKLPGSKSAGRVQSVALRLICERETKIENFEPREYWTVEAVFETPGGETVEALLTHLDGHKLGKMDIGGEARAQAAVDAAQARDFTVAKVEQKQTRRHPAPPFTTSTLQQEASRKLRMTAKRTMQVAQRLYEGVSIGGETVGLITYMRTDGVQIAGEAIAAARALIGGDFGDNYVPDKARVYKSKAKNAQEAHEAIRPTDAFRRPRNVSAYLDDDQNRLYQLIWNRAVASQMESAVLDQVSADIGSPDAEVVFRATGSTLVFDGFYKLYREGKDDSENGNGEKILPKLTPGQGLERRTVTPEQHFTQPPPRFTEASLVKRLEKLGIGRPSTYASIISVLQDRNYVKLEKRRFEPVDRGRLVTAFLDSYFTRYVEYDFTAELEEKLDDISGGRIDWKVVLRDFWDAFNNAVAETKDLRVSEVLDKLDELLGPHFFRPGEDGSDPRQCPSCDDGRLNLKLGKFGAFIGCNNYPDCKFTRPLEVANGNGGGEASTANGPKELGPDPETGDMVTLRKGPYGFYVQRGEETADGKKKIKPKRSSVPKDMNPADIDLASALGLLSLPRDIGPDPETGDMITAGLGRFGPFIKVGGTYVSLKGEDDVLTIGLNRAVHLLADAPRKAPPKELGMHPDDDRPVVRKAGRWGPYVQHGRLMATLPKGTDPDTVTLEQAIELLAAKAAKGGKGAKKKKKAAPGKKKTAAKKKPAPKKTETAAVRNE